MFKEWVYTALLIVVTLGWSANLVAGMFRFNGWEPDQTVNATFAAIVVGSFAVRHQAEKRRQEIESDTPKGGDHKR